MNPERLFITGAGGQLGKELSQLYPEATALTSSEMDITDRDKLATVDWSKYSIVINAAAYTKVDEAETDEGKKAAWSVNAGGAENLAVLTAQHDITLVHISSDYVFDGQQADHREDEVFSPLNVYGQSKAAGDIAVSSKNPNHYILRTSWVIGEGKNFINTMIGLSDKYPILKVVSDQIGRPTFTTELARAIDFMLNNQIEFGTYNVSNSGRPVSWADLARKAFEVVGINQEIIKDTTTKDYFAGKTIYAKRPLNSTFDLSKITAAGFSPKDWEINLNEYLHQEES